MTPADTRILELINRWLQSLDVHLKYVDLDDAAYWRAQEWPKHDRPTRWILELARQKALELKAQCETYAARQDSAFAEALEQMQFLANLVGSQNIQRFIPLAEPPKAGSAAAASQNNKRAADDEEEDTREMPKPKLTPGAQAASKPSTSAPRASDKAPSPAKSKPVQATPATTATIQVVVADAIRLLKWGRKWHEIAESIARMADRPPLAEVRRILRAHRAEIDDQL